MTYRFVVIKEKVKGQVFGSTGVKQVKMPPICWQWSQNVHQVNTIKNQNSLPYVRCLMASLSGLEALFPDVTSDALNNCSF